MKRLLAILVIMLFLIGCGRTIYLMTDYANMKIEGKSLVIADMDIFIGNPKDVTDDLGEGNPKKVYREFFESNLINRMVQLSTFDEVYFAEVTNEDEFSEQVFDIGKNNQIYMNIPEDGQPVKTDSVYGDFVLFVQDFQVFRKNANTSNQTGIKGITWSSNLKSKPELKATFNFVIWDNEKKQVVSYGKANCPTAFGFRMKTETWERSITDVAKEILQETPFENFLEEMK